MTSRLENWKSRVWLFFGCLVRYARLAIHRYYKLNLKEKLFIWGLVYFYIALGTVFIVVGASKIAQFSYDLAQDLSHMRFGWLCLGLAIVVICFPPSIGQTSLVILCGFAYGMKGFFLAAGASLIGSALVFTTLRFLFANRLRRWTSTNETWKALESVVSKKGLPLIILIRLSSFPPWAYSNAFFASIDPVQLWQFVVATVFILPKLLLYTFIGSRLASLSDEGQRNEMDTKAKIINSCLVGGGFLIGIIVSIIIYRLVQAHMRRMAKDTPSETDETGAEVNEDSETAPLLDNHSSDPVDSPLVERRQSLDV